MVPWGARKQGGGQEIILNVYDLNEANEYLYPAGFGVYHSGVQIGGKEYTFAGGGGIFSHDPKDAPGARYRCSVNMGTVEGGQSAVDDAISRLRGEFGPDRYNLINRNCNSFSDAFCQELTGKGIPGWVNRVAYIGSWFSCLVPPQMLGEAPVNETGVGGGVAGSSGPAFAAFGGSGTTVGGGTLPVAGAAGSSGTTDSSLTDRREKVRLARLAALEGKEAPA